MIVEDRSLFTRLRRWWLDQPRSKKVGIILTAVFFFGLNGYLAVKWWLNHR